MNAAELARLVSTWTDALTVAEMIGNPFLRVGADWDLHDWQMVELPGGLHFQRIDGAGHVVEAVILVERAGLEQRPLLIVEKHGSGQALSACPA